MPPEADVWQQAHSEVHYFCNFISAPIYFHLHLHAPLREWKTLLQWGIASQSVAL